MHRLGLVVVQRRLLRFLGQLRGVQARLVVRFGRFDRVAELLGDGLDLLGALPEQLAELVFGFLEKGRGLAEGICTYKCGGIYNIKVCTIGRLGIDTDTYIQFDFILVDAVRGFV